MESVAIAYCNNYEIILVEKSLINLLNRLQIDLPKIIAGKKVLLKPNMLSAHTPSKGITTHPVVVEGVIRLLKDCGSTVWLGDSPNGMQRSLEEVWEKTGMEDLCRKYGVVRKYFEREKAEYRGDILISNAVLEADYIINLPKLKTHGLTFMTCAVKNMFGAVPGLKKTYYHRISPAKEDFSRLLVRVAEETSPDLTIVDAVESMAGNGPSGGYIVETSFLAAGNNIHAIDHLMSRMIGFRPDEIDTLCAAEEMGLIDLKENPLVVSDSAQKIQIKGFKFPVTYTNNLWSRGWFKFLIAHFVRFIKVRPRVDKSSCAKCGMCVGICPVSAIEFLGEYPHIDNSKCSECYCCHEVCPENSIELRESLFFKLIKKFHRTSP